MPNTEPGEPQTLLEHALAYAAQGIPVFPLVPGTKKPFKDSHGFLDATTDPAQIRDWWTKDPEANIGMPTGAVSGRIVLDLDRHNPSEDGLKFCAEQEKKLGSNLKGPWVSTPNNGMHRHHGVGDHEIPSFNWMGRDDKRTGFDVKCEGGLVLLPPSVLIKNGVLVGEYKWEGENIPLEELPEAWVEALLYGRVARDGRKESVSRDLRFRLGFLCPICDGHKGLRAGEGVRCHGYMSEDGQKAFCAREEHTNGKIKQSNSALYAHDAFGLCDCGKTHKKGKPKSGTLICTPYSAIPKVPLKWLWDPYIPIGKVTMYDGATAVGKTTLLMAVAAAITRPDGVLPVPVEGTLRPEFRPVPTGKVLMFNIEDPVDDTLRQRAENANVDLTQIFCPHLEDREGKPSVIELDDLSAIEAKIIEMEPVLVIFDPLFTFVPSNRNVTQINSMNDIITALGVLAHKCKVSIVCVRHPRKSKEGTALDSGLGATEILTGARAAICSYRHPTIKGLRVFAQLKTNVSAELPSLTYQIVPKGNQGEFMWGDTSTLTADDMHRQERTLAANAPKVERGVELILELLKEHGDKIPVHILDIAATRENLSERTMVRARTQANVKNIRVKDKESGERHSFVIPRKMSKYQLELGLLTKKEETNE